jgi:hypothetical protein
VNLPLKIPLNPVFGVLLGEFLSHRARYLQVQAAALRYFATEAIKEEHRMTRSSKKTNVYLEIGKKKTFAGAVDWPGWSRSGREEESALQALIEYGPRYALVLRQAGLEFQAPADRSELSVIERLEGSPTTDFGAPGAVPSSDAAAVDDEELQRLQALMKACWQAFDEAVQAARGKELRKGPRGGGRELEGIMRHVLGAGAGYLTQLGWRFKADEEGDPDEELQRTRQATLEALAAAVRGELPTQGPRGGARWTPRYFVRRSAWHVLDHVWELEDRVL